MRRFPVVCLLLILGASVLPSTSHAENTIRLKNGSTITGVIEKMDGDIVIIRTAYGLLRIPENDLLDIGTEKRKTMPAAREADRNLKSYYMNVGLELGRLLNTETAGYSWPSVGIGLQILWGLDDRNRWQLGMECGFFVLSSATDPDYGAGFFELALALRFYPKNAANGFFLHGALGFSDRSYLGNDVNHPEYVESEIGAVCSFGIGYALPLSRGTSLAAELLYSLDTALYDHHRIIGRLGLVL